MKAICEIKQFILIQFIILFFVLGLTLTPDIFAEVKNSNGMRNVTWGMSKIEVKNLETAPVHETMMFYAQIVNKNNLLVYREKVLGYKVVLNYHFKNGLLTSGKIYLDEGFKDLNKYILIFNQIKIYLTKKYGKPIEDLVVRSKKLKKVTPKEYPVEIARRRMRLFTEWKIGKTTCFLVLEADKEEMKLYWQFEPFKK